MTDRSEWNDKAIDGLADTVKATAAVPMEVATLKRDFQALTDTVDRNHSENKEAIAAVRTDIAEWRASVRTLLVGAAVPIVLLLVGILFKGG